MSLAIETRYSDPKHGVDAALSIQRQTTQTHRDGFILELFPSIWWGQLGSVPLFILGVGSGIEGIKRFRTVYYAVLPSVLSSDGVPPFSV